MPRAECSGERIGFGCIFDSRDTTCQVPGADVMPPLSSWEQLQIAFPAVRKRLIPLADACQSVFASFFELLQVQVFCCCAALSLLFESSRLATFGIALLPPDTTELSRCCILAREEPPRLHDVAEKDTCGPVTASCCPGAYHVHVTRALVAQCRVDSRQTN